MLQDVRYSFRALRLTPAFTLVAVAVLALGIGATTAIFELIHTVFLRPLPLTDPGRIVVPVSTQLTRGIRDGGVAYADYIDWREQKDVFASLALWRPGSLDLTGGDRPERVQAMSVTGEFFQTLGAEAVHGRVFGVEAERPGESPVVLSYGAWERVFGGRTDAVGRTIHLSGNPYTVVGVLRAGQDWPAENDVYVPLRLDPARNPGLTRRDNFIFRAFARLRPDASIEQGRTRLATLAAAIEREQPAARAGWSYDLETLQVYTVGQDFRQALLILSAAVGLVLIIACVNVANLLLARGSDRRRELAVRAALGASRARIRRALLVESGVLALCGGIGGLFVGYWLSRGLVSIAPDDAPLMSTPELNLPMIGFTVAVALVTTLLFGVLPALQVSTVSPGEALKESVRTGASRRSGRMRDLLVVAEMALAIMLLVGAALAIRSLLALSNVDPGVSTANVLTARIILPGARYADAPKRARFYEELIARVGSVPGVVSASATSRLPAGGPGFGLGRAFLREGQPEPPASSEYSAQWTVVTPGYFTALGLRLVKGRDFTPADDQASLPVMIVSARLAEQMFPGQDPIGKRVQSWRDERVLREIVGVVGDVKYFGLSDRPRNAVYVPHRQDSWGTMMLAVKTAGDPLSAAGAVRAQVSALDPMLALGDVGALADFTARSVDSNRFTARLLGAFAALALLLAAVGVYGVMAYIVSRRSHELGLRLALGATRAQVAWLVAARGMLLAGAGLVIGGGAAAALARWMRAALPEIGPFDPAAFAAASVTLLLAAFAACMIPALRATRVDPADALRHV